jgi:hypothetical protein
MPRQSGTFFFPSILGKGCSAGVTDSSTLTTTATHLPLLEMWAVVYISIPVPHREVSINSLVSFNIQIIFAFFQLTPACLCGLLLLSWWHFFGGCLVGFVIFERQDLTMV